MTDPANRDLIDSVSRGECPHELEPADRRTKVLVNLARSADEYREPEKPKYKAFSGTGRTLTGLDTSCSVCYDDHLSVTIYPNLVPQVLLSEVLDT